MVTGPQPGPRPAAATTAPGTPDPARPARAAVGGRQFGSVHWGVLQSGVTRTVLPCVLLLQRYYVTGLAAGAVKS
jgi:ABC-type glycerol-3-phosphate transport system permease component